MNPAVVGHTSPTYSPDCAHTFARRWTYLACNGVGPVHQPTARMSRRRGSTSTPTYSARISVSSVPSCVGPLSMTLSADSAVHMPQGRACCQTHVPRQAFMPVGVD